MPQQRDRLVLAQEQLERVQVAAIDPVDWSDLSLYAFYSLENAVVSAAEHFGVAWQRTHPSKVDVARDLHAKYGLPDVSELLRRLNELRKSYIYGETPTPSDLSAEDVAMEVEIFVQKVSEAVVDST